ncbi:hypothetical protein ACLOJK_019660 [Asimina triloba]
MLAPGSWMGFRDFPLTELIRWADGNGWVQPLVDPWPRFESAAGELISDGRLLSIIDVLDDVAAQSSCLEADMLVGAGRWCSMQVDAMGGPRPACQMRRKIRRPTVAVHDCWPIVAVHADSSNLNFY